MSQIEPVPSAKEIIQVLKEIQNSNIQALQDLCKKYPKLHWTKIYYDKTGDTVLHCAARLNLLHVIDYLLSNFDPKTVDCKNKDDKTALHEAAQFSQYKACEKLLQFGANINALKRGDWTPLMLACTKIDAENSLKTVKLLLENGAIVNYKNKDGWTALHLISREGAVSILKALLRHGLDVKLKTRNGRTALHIAALHGKFDIVKILLEYGLNVDAKDGCGNTPLHEAVLGNNIEICEILISNKADICARNNRGYNLLHLAASEGHLKMMNFVLTNLKFNVNDMTTDGFTALHCAARNGHRSAFSFLKECGADMNIRDKCSRNAMSYFR